MEEAFAALLLNDTAVSALVGQRVNYLKHPQGQPYPAIVLNVIDDGAGYTLEGEDGLDQGRVQVDCYADDYASAKTLSRTVRAVLSGYRGGDFQGIFLDGSGDRYSGASNDITTPSRVSMDFMTNWKS